MRTGWVAALAAGCALVAFAPAMAQQTSAFTYKEWRAVLTDSGWTAVMDDGDGQVVFYKPGPRQTDGNPAGWSRYEWRTDHLNGQRSVAVLTEFDCAGKRYRNLQQIAYAYNNLSGELGRVGPDAGWQPMNPGSGAALYAARSCPKAHH